MREWLDSCMLAAVICLPAPEPNSADDKKTTEGEASASKEESKPAKPKPIPIGFISLANEPVSLVHHRHSEIGISILQAYQGKGYGTEAIEWALRWAFRRANLHRIAITAFGWNEGAIRLYERIGFIVEGRKRDFFWHDGRYNDIVDLAMLEHEWRDRYDKQEPAKPNA